MAFEYLTDEQVARSNFVIWASDQSGAIQSLTGTRKFTHAETGASYPASIFSEPLERLKGIWLFKVNTAAPPDTRWFTNIQLVVDLLYEVPEVKCSFTSDWKEFTPELVNDSRVRIWADADSRLQPHDNVWGRAEEFNAEYPADILAYRASIRSKYDETMLEMDAAADTLTVARSEADYESYVDGLIAPDPNPWIS